MTILLLLLCLPLIVIDAVFLAEVTLGIAPSPDRRPAARPARIALLIPAHNEEAGVRAAIAAIRAAVPPETRLLLVAHNCDDRTADEALAGGAEVTPLDDPGRRGKGYALAHGRDVLALDPPDVAIIVDADSVPEPGTVERLAATALDSGRAVQACYLLRSRAGDAPMVQISNFAFLTKNLIRQRGGRRLGAPALLTGSGMAFPWPLLAELDLATGNIVEDLALGVALVRQDRAPLFEERARVWSMPSSEKGTQTQRARWEGGFMATARRFALPLIGDGLRRGAWPLTWMGLHLLVPPLTLLLIVNAAWSVLLAVVALFGGPLAPLVTMAMLLLLLLGAVLAAWAAAGRQVLSGPVLARVPLYILWKIGLYARLVRKTETPAWVRTERVD